ncbi:hypothetical protein NX059_010266 [Plenodomus lindquistii]|nr:hypothetical protein NX059_010266 [Plenodomus lindquistii]
MAQDYNSLSDMKKAHKLLLFVRDNDHLKELCHTLLELDTSGVEQFLDVAVTNLPDDHYTKHDNECVICYCAEEAKPPAGSELNGVSKHAIVKTNDCNHVYHKVCLGIWLISERTREPDTGAGTCPMCRGVLITNVKHKHPRTDNLLYRIGARISTMQERLAEISGDHPHLTTCRRIVSAWEESYSIYLAYVNQHLSDELFQVGPLFAQE